MSASIDSLLRERRSFPPPKFFQERAWVKSRDAYEAMYRRSIEEPEDFWAEMASEFTWFLPWRAIRNYSFQDKIFIEWFAGATTNITVNCLDRHVAEGKGERTAYYWVGNEPGVERRLTYRELLDATCQVANALQSLGIGKGDRVAIYMPMIPEAVIAMLACARIGAIHNVVFAGFSPQSLADRIVDSRCKLLITSDGLKRGTKSLCLKVYADEALKLAEAAGHRVERCLLYRHTGEAIAFDPTRDRFWHEMVPSQKTSCPAAVMESEDPLFILYTSGSTGKPKGVLHTVGGYMVHTAITFKYIFDYHPDDLYWCTADIGWVTGHSYSVYGPLANAASSIIFEGIPTHPHPDRFWEIIAEYNVTIFYTAPTAIRALEREGPSWPAKHDLSSLRLLGSVGEPINPEAWIWYHHYIGGDRCPIVDTWWQTETGGILISPLPGAIPVKPGSAGVPFFGVRPKIVREDGSDCETGEGGYLVIAEPWPGMMRTVYGHHERFKETYFTRFPGLYFAGDGARRDADGDYWFMGRVDDVVKVSGHRIGTAEVESALVAHPAVTEAAVVGVPHAVKGEGIYGFVTLEQGTASSPQLAQELITHVVTVIGPIARPEKIQFAPQLPKTRSGKIMRRILRKIAAGDVENLGDTSTLSDPTVVEDLLQGRHGGVSPLK